MAWFKVDDGFYTSQKVLSIPRKDRATAVGVWLLVGTWSADKMTDGLVPDFILEEFGCTPEIREILVIAGLWKIYDTGSDCVGIEFHDWCDYQPTKAQLQDKQKARSEAGKLGGQRSGEARRSKTEANVKQNEANANPEPEPEPEPNKNISQASLRVTLLSFGRIIQGRLARIKPELFSCDWLRRLSLGESSRVPNGLQAIRIYLNLHLSHTQPHG